MSKSIDQSDQALNAAQQLAVNHIHGPLLILAGPGSGKTSVVTHRIANMIESGIPSHKIVALTFTNKAADEMKQRVEQLSEKHSAWIGTFHKFCARLLRVYAPTVGLTENFTIYDTTNSKAALKDALELADVSQKHFSPEQIAEKISNAKSHGIDCHQYQPQIGNALENVVAKVYKAYQQVLQNCNAVDFDDLLLHIVTMLRVNPELRAGLDNRFEYVLVDEYQDTNAAQYSIIRGLSLDHPNLCVTGDPDQSIYGWRGANLNNILNFERDFEDVKVVRLEQNYRSTKLILEVADQLILNNVRRKHKDLITDNQTGNPVKMIAYPNAQQESSDIVANIVLAIENDGLRPRDFAILYRTNWLSRSFEHELRSNGIPYQIVHGQEFYQRKEIKDLFAFLHLLNNPKDNIALQRIINVPPRKIGKVTIQRLKNYANDRKLALLEAARVCGLDDSMSKQAATKVAGFVAIYDEIAEVKTNASVRLIIEKIVAVIGYREFLIDGGTEEAHERAANVDELIAAADEFDREHPDDGGLEAYLEQTALVNDTDAWENNSDAVSLMTMHAAKGLEFPHVFIVGLEDGLLPHERSANNDAELEEERRLLFVGITRAKLHLQLSRIMLRYKRGQHWPTIASRFLMELPREKMNVFEPQSYEFPEDEWDNIDQDVDYDSEVHEALGDWNLTSTVESDLASRPDPATNPQTKTKQQLASKPLKESSMVHLVTASELLETGTQDSEAKADEKTIRWPVESFKLGMMVKHPKYGPGKIKELSGKDEKRVATVAFFTAEEKSFRLAFCPLQPVN